MKNRRREERRQDNTKRCKVREYIHKIKKSRKGRKDRRGDKEKGKRKKRRKAKSREE